MPALSAGTLLRPPFDGKFDYDACALKAKYCPNTEACKISRSVHDAARDVARAIAKTEVYIVSRRERKKVEMLFAQSHPQTRPISVVRPEWSQR